MTKQNEKDYYKHITDDNLTHALRKPYSDAEAGVLVAQMAAALELLPYPPVKILDLGCGTGWTSRFFAEAGRHVTGYDLSEFAISLASDHIPPHLRTRLSFRAGDFEYIPYKNEFDAVLFIDSLHHSEDETIVLRQVIKVLKKGAICIVIEPGSGHSKSIQSQEAISKYGVTERDMPPWKIKQAAKQVGFGHIITYPHPGQMFRALYKPTEKLSPYKQKLLRNPFLRFMAVLERVTTDRLRHGLVTMRKPY